MKIRSLLKSESPIITSTLFFIGIVSTAGVLYEYQNTAGWITIYHVSVVTGFTFLLGLISIYGATRSIKQTVVYLPSKKEQDHQQNLEDTESQLSIDVLERIVRSGTDISQNLINELSRQLQAGQIALYVSNGSTFELKQGFALSDESERQYTYSPGEGLIGRVAKEGKSLYIDELPKGYITIFSGLGAASPTHLAIVPLQDENEVKGVLEIAMFQPLTGNTLLQLENLCKAWTEAGL